MMDVEFGFTRTLNNVSYEEARERITVSLKEEGFGVLTEIDVKATLKQKLDADFRKYCILGACNPPIAHQALKTNPGVGLLLPCNVVVTENDEGNAVISVADPKAMLGMMGDAGPFEPLMEEARLKLARALEKA
jgi:uncharacterized protein (DUF302 family)